MAVVLPFVPSLANYRVGCALEGRQYIFDVRWNGTDRAWFFDLLAEDEAPIVSGIKVAIGASFGSRSTSVQFPPGAFVAWDTSGAKRDAGFDDMGVRVLVYYLTVDDVRALAADHASGSDG